VSVGGVAATGVVYNSATSITATVPPAPGGNANQYDVLVTDAGGTSQTSSNDLRLPIDNEVGPADAGGA
jgi:hypothetical protein